MAVLAAGLSLGTVLEPAAVLPASIAVAALAGLLVAGRDAHRPLPWSGATVAATSLAVTAGYDIGPDKPGSAAVALVEGGAVVWLIVLVVRRSPFRMAVPVGCLLGLAQALLVLRALNATPVLDTVAFVGFAGLPSIAAAIGGAYLRSLDARRVRGIDDARRGQRLELARDLHDFVAHDVSGIVVQAQAAQVLAERRPDEVAAALRRIEAAGLRALATMDRTVHMLRNDRGHESVGNGPREPDRGIADLAELSERFSEGGTRALVDVAVEPTEIPRELDATAYRIVVEALTNVRRHAPRAREVRIAVRRTTTGDKPTLTLEVSNDGPAPHGDQPGHGGLARRGSAPAGGLGLAGLAERVEALGGGLIAGPDQVTEGWHVRADLPLEAS